MHLQSLRIFSDVARARSFSRGASAVGVSQSAASQAVHQLEAHLGVKLIDRSQRPLLLTAAGELFFRGCKGLLERYEALTDEVRVVDRAVAGVVRVAAIYSVVLHHLPAVQKRFAQRHPHAALRIECLPPARVYRAVQEDQADLGLLSYPRHDRHLAIHDWREERMVVVCAPDDALAGHAHVAPAALAGRRFVAFDHELPIRRAVDRFFRKHHVAVKVALEFGDIEAIKQAIAMQAGVGILPEPTVRNEVRAGTLAAVPIEGEALTRPLAIVQRRGKRLTLTAERFLALLDGQAEHPAQTANHDDPATVPRTRRGPAKDTTRRPGQEVTS